MRVFRLMEGGVQAGLLQEDSLCPESPWVLFSEPNHSDSFGFHFVSNRCIIIARIYGV